MTDGGSVWRGQGCVNAVFKNNNVFGVPYDYVYSNFTGVAKNVRIVGDTWFAALGHVAQIDFLLKKRELGWEEPGTIFLTARNPHQGPAPTLLRAAGLPQQDYSDRLANELY